jgi:hypothetical protein
VPLTVLRRLDCVLEPTRQAVTKKAEQLVRAYFDREVKL